MANSAPKTIEWTGRAVRIIDQTLLPGRLVMKTLRTDRDMWEAIRTLRVRGAPAIGVAAAYGVVLGAKGKTAAAVRRAAQRSADYLATSRPTAVNLFWALERMRAAAGRIPNAAPASDARDILLAEALDIHRSDEATCAAIARHGAPLLSGARGVLTHCNAGALATAGVGTAVGVILEAARTAGFTVYADETRPLLQGARLTTWELLRAGVETRLITDSTAASVLARGAVQAVVVGADRIAANGDTANKVGTLPLAICAKHFRVPFYVAAPLSTVDPSIADGTAIPIEERDPREVTELTGVRVAPRGVKVFSPAFDVTPAALITAIITEAGVLRRPFPAEIRKALRARDVGEGRH